MNSEQAAWYVMQDFGEEDEHFEHYVLTDNNDNTIDLYSVGHESVTRSMCNQGVEVPFKQGIQLHSLKGEVVWVEGLFDGGAMVAAMCTSVFERVKH